MAALTFFGTIPGFLETRNAPETVALEEAMIAVIASAAPSGR